MEIKITGFEELTDSLKILHSKIDQLVQKPEEKWLDNDQFICSLNISKKTAQHYRDHGLIEFSQIGAKIYYKHSDVNKFLEDHKIKRFGGKL